MLSWLGFTAGYANPLLRPDQQDQGFVIREHIFKLYTKFFADSVHRFFSLAKGLQAGPQPGRVSQS